MKVLTCHADTFDIKFLSINSLSQIKSHPDNGNNIRLGTCFYLPEIDSILNQESKNNNSEMELWIYLIEVGIFRDSEMICVKMMTCHGQITTKDIMNGRKNHRAQCYQ